MPAIHTINYKDKGRRIRGRIRERNIEGRTR
jgi:hypothetical protein